MSGVEIRQRAASEGQRGSGRGQEGRPAPVHRASWSTVIITFWTLTIFQPQILPVLKCIGSGYLVSATPLTVYADLFDTLQAFLSWFLSIWFGNYPQIFFCQFVHILNQQCISKHKIFTTSLLFYPKNLDTLTLYLACQNKFILLPVIVSKNCRLSGRQFTPWSDGAFCGMWVYTVCSGLSVEIR